MEALAGYRVFVGGISWKADEVQLENFFSTHGQVLECKIIMDKVTGKSKGYGFVTFKDAHAAEFVKQTANFNLLGKNMNVGDAVRKASEPNGASNSGTRSPHGNYNNNNNNGYHQSYYNPNYYNRQNDTQFYGQYSPDGSFYPAQYYYPQGYRGNPQYQYVIQGQSGYPGGYSSFPSAEGEQQVPSDSASPPNYVPGYAPYNHNGAPNYPPYYNNNSNYYNAYYHSYPGGGVPVYGYNQNFNPTQHDGGDETGHPAEHSTPANAETMQPQHDHVNTAPLSNDATPNAHSPEMQPHSAESEPTPSSSSTPISTNDTTSSGPQYVTSSPQPVSQRSLPKSHANTGSPAQARYQGGPRSSPRSQQRQPQQPKQQRQPKNTSHRPPPHQDPVLHSHVIPTFSKLSVSSN